MIPGLPNIPEFKGLETSGVDALISFGGAFAVNMIFGNQWGIYSEFGVPVMLVDTVYSVKYQISSQVSQAPVEKGTFASYNKVQEPYKATVALVRGGGDATTRGLLLTQLDALSKSTLKYHIVTPEFVHTNAVITGYDYAREPQSAARMVVANVHLEEVREVSVAYESVETANPEDSAIVEIGEIENVQEVPESMASRSWRWVTDTVSSVGEMATKMGDVSNRGASAW